MIIHANLIMSIFTASAYDLSDLPLVLILCSTWIRWPLTVHVLPFIPYITSVPFKLNSSVSQNSMGKSHIKLSLAFSVRICRILFGTIRQPKAKCMEQQQVFSCNPYWNGCNSHLPIFHTQHIPFSLYHGCAFWCKITDTSKK